MRISDASADVCAPDLFENHEFCPSGAWLATLSSRGHAGVMSVSIKTPEEQQKMREAGAAAASVLVMLEPYVKPGVSTDELNRICHEYIVGTLDRSEEQTSELQSLMSISYAVFCLKTKK